MRAIDADRLVKTIEKAQMESRKVNVLSLINDAPTVERILCRSRFWSNECLYSNAFEQGYAQGFHCGFAKGAEIPSFRNTGKWITDKLHNTVCSNCGGIRRDNRVDHIDFCNKCGTYMRDEEE